MTDIAQMPQSVLMPITQAAQQMARQFAIEQPTEEKALQVYLNTLAVYAVNNYLRIMDISTDLKGGDSWNPVIRFACDVADLWVTGVGRLECRPLQVINRDPSNLPFKTDQEDALTGRWGDGESDPDPDLSTWSSSPPEFIRGESENSSLLESPGSYHGVSPRHRVPASERPLQSQPASISCYVPPETQDDRIGYVVVQIDLEQQEATLLGFAPTVTSEQLTIGELQPITEMLKNLESQKTQLVPLAKLSQWCQGIFEVGWQPVEAFLDNALAHSSFTQVAFRRSITKEIKRAKLINFGRHKPGIAVTLVVTLTQQEKTNGIGLQVFPQTGESFLPTKLKLAVLDESGTCFFEIASGSNDRFIQSRQFSGQRGERFRVQLSFGKISLMQDFAI
ncbi:DUF1822 family protein [Microseira wollei]|uniref:DUF1822 family protein n=1 Tax=Microseira wollei NIES-4236 TaxID=2530354 RepID=A0AAV3XLV9_9CYAN|nr:DUF1822 family protein [Microseira wollei]GET40512.1 hypothetical protein MiSe_53210 [Microseira wollei NIES-4236]